ncbi:MAG: hypothetical protein JWP22_2291 [Ramlibacter sp.]|jgi:hypothetical protein|nr:hypothetical protein [Ramlibacter sp.]MDB5913616.1 hypothetical protein [Ramlibacter sp.]
MATSPKLPTDKADTSPRRKPPARQGAGTQPAATGANRGSPAAGVMKQFQKTKSETGGQS